MQLTRVQHSVTVVTGFEKGSGKTSFLNLVLPLARAVGPVGLFTIGVDGAQKAGFGLPSPEIRVEPGDLVMTTEAFARTSSARFEFLESVSGHTALGRLILGRATRGGSVTLVGSEHFSALAEILERVRREGWAPSILVDGAVNRLTQVGALGQVQFVFTARLNPSNFERVLARMRSLAALARLPEVLEPGPDIHRLEGPLTLEVQRNLPSDIQALSVEDFTKIFLEPEACLRLLERQEVSVRQRFDLLGFSVGLRDLSRERVLRAVGPDLAETLLLQPFELLPVERGA